MPRKGSKSRMSQNQPDDSVRDVKKLFDLLHPHIPVAVEQVCARLNPRPQPAEQEDFVEEIDLKLRENDYAHLRSFHSDSAPETWLFSVVRNYIRNQLRSQRKMVRLDDLPPDAFVAAPDQETKMLLEEIESIALGTRSPLTPGEKRLFRLWRKGLNDQEISEILGIKIASVQSEKSRMFRKIREMMEGGEKKRDMKRGEYFFFEIITFHRQGF